jgi:hypothetical protein
VDVPGCSSGFWRGLFFGTNERRFIAEKQPTLFWRGLRAKRELQSLEVMQHAQLYMKVGPGNTEKNKHVE